MDEKGNEKGEEIERSGKEEKEHPAASKRSAGGAKPLDERNL